MILPLLSAFPLALAAPASPVPAPASPAPAAPASPAPTADERAAMASLLAQGHARRVPELAPASPGSRMLDVYRHGDLAVLHDADGEWFAELLSRGADLDWALGTVYDAFYEHYEDDYQYLTVFLVRDFGLFGAFYAPMANDVTGIGYANVSNVETFDGTGDTQIEGLIFMNYVGMWAEDPALGRYVFGQEFMHRWGAFVRVQHPELDEYALLGRDVAHWSFWMDTPNSPMEGNRWVDNGDGTWTTDAGSGSTYSALDLYLMGLATADEVGEQTLLALAEGEDGGGNEPSSAPVYLGGGADVTVAATPIRFGLDDIVAAEGERVPSMQDSPKRFRMAFAVLALEGDDLSEATFAMVDGVRTTFEADWEDDVLLRADLDTTLGEGTAPEWGADTDTGADTGDDGGEPIAEEDPAEEAEVGGCGCAAASGAAGGPASGRTGAGVAIAAALGAVALARGRRQG